MNAMPRRFLFILADLGLSLLFLLLISLASVDFNNRLQQEEQHNLTRQQQQQQQVQQQALQEQNGQLHDALQKKDQQTQTLLQDNLTLLDQNSSLMVRLNPDQPASASGNKQTASAPTPEQQQLQNNQDRLQRLQHAAAKPATQPGSSPAHPAAGGDAYWQKMVTANQDPPATATIPAEMVILPAEEGSRSSPPEAANGAENGRNGSNGENFWEDMLSFFQSGSPGSGEKANNKEPAASNNAPAVATAKVVHTVIAENRQESFNKLLRQLQADLQRQQIVAEIYPKNGLLTLPGLLDFASESHDPDPARQPQMQRLAKILLQRLACFTASSHKTVQCPANHENGPQLDSVIVTGFSGSAPLGSGAFRYHWNQASSRASQFLAELSAADADLPTLRNRHGEALFRLDGFLPAEQMPLDSNPKPQRQVALRLVWE
ncbi:MAG: hypothetical protein HQM06_06895 [Magnetococcales bacterium]|nr:hypothetical protein [Magnetococcales bacterium]